MRRRNPDSAGGFTSVALVFLGGLVGGAAASLMIPLLIWPGVWVRLIGLVPLVGGIWLFSSARAAFRRRRTALMPWTPSTNLVQDGPYRFSRNPIYLAFASMYLGAALIFDSICILIMLVIAVVLFDRMQIPREERYLQEKFGEEFARYRAKVRRWV
jgi:protein-S-isoprenylcysteine O-methyltransferase Ste14